MKNKNLLLLFIAIFFISCGQESINNDVQKPIRPTDDIEEVSPEGEVLEDTSIDDYNEGFEAGETQGYDNGYEEGFETGVTQGYNNGYAQGTTDGSLLGQTQGYNTGYTEGSIEGFNTGETQGYNTGYTEGFDAGETQGYKEGFNAGVDSLMNEEDISNRYFYNDYSEGLYDIADYEGWYDELGNLLDYSDSSFYNTTDDRLELNYTDASGVSVFQFLFHSTDGNAYDADNTSVIGYQTTNIIEALSENNKITLRINYTLPDDSSIDGVYASLFWLDNNLIYGNNTDILLNVEDRFKYGDGYTPLIKGETNTLEVTFNLNPENTPFDFDSIYFDLILEAEYSDNTKAKLFINSVEILRE